MAVCVTAIPQFQLIGINIQPVAASIRQQTLPPWLVARTRCKTGALLLAYNRKQSNEPKTYR